MIKSRQITQITKSHYKGKVYNVELHSKRDVTQDDLFWICNNIVVHNCFPKDLNALIHLAKRLNVKPTVMSAVWEKNLEVIPIGQRDWEKMNGRAVSKK